jgi:hypothetical protein
MKHPPSLQVVLEPETGEDVSARLQAAFDMLFAGMVIELPEEMRAQKEDLTEPETSLS